MKTLSIEVSHEGTWAETHSVIMKNDQDGSSLDVSYAKTPRGTKMCLARYAKANGFEMVKGVWQKQ